MKDTQPYSRILAGYWPDIEYRNAPPSCVEPKKKRHCECSEVISRSLHLICLTLIGLPLTTIGAVSYICAGFFIARFIARFIAGLDEILAALKA